MGRWAQSQHRGGGGEVTVAASAPILVAEGDPDLSWTWSDPDPDQWRIDSSPDGLDPWIIEDLVNGGDRTYNHADAPSFFRIIGTDFVPDPTTPFSNVVHQFP